MTPLFDRLFPRTDKPGGEGEHDPLGPAAAPGPSAGAPRGGVRNVQPMQPSRAAPEPPPAPDAPLAPADLELPGGASQPGEAPGGLPADDEHDRWLAPDDEPFAADDHEEEEQPTAQRSPVSVVSEPGPPPSGEDDEFVYHTGVERPTGLANAVEFIEVHKAFGRNKVLAGLNMVIPEGKISMIVGPSGTGKSVCIKHMVGLLYPDAGDVLVEGQSVPDMVDDELFEMRKKFGVLFQDGALFGSMNLYDNVAFPLRQHTDKSEEEIAEIVDRRLQEVGLGDENEKMPNELSGGMRKRAGFARALVLDPHIVLFDEPDSGLDPVRTALLCELIQEVHEESGGAYVVITHDILSVRRVGEFISLLWKGRVVESGPAEELFNSENQFVRQFLSGEARGPLGME